jgi:hypothetical protein
VTAAKTPYPTPPPLGVADGFRETPPPTAPHPPSELRPRLRSIFRRRRNLVAHSIIPVEVPVLTETKRLWVAGRKAKAIRYAYPAALADLQRAYGVTFQPTWTHEEIQVLGMGPAMGDLPEFFLFLYRLYEPVRYGEPERLPDGDPVELLQSIYGHPEMWQLYAQGMLARPVRRTKFARRRRAVRPPAGAT